MASQEQIRKRNGGGATTSEIPDKLYFRIGEVAKLCEVPAYVLRFWEGEFPQLKPNKGGTGQRLYRKRDVEMALRIKTLLYDEGYTIPGARQAFKAELRSAKDAVPAGVEGAQAAGNAGVDPAHLLALQKDLQDLLALLSRPAAMKTVQPIQTIRSMRPAPVAARLVPPAPRQFPKPQLVSSKSNSGLFDLLDE